MKFLKKADKNSNPTVSLVLLDWSVRESFHFFEYLRKQNVTRNQFEIIVVEYYSRVAQGLQEFADFIDTWVLLEMPEEFYYHKHLMYNVGIVFARGKIITFCDSDSIVTETFVQSIIKEFELRSKIVLHLDQFRNNRKDLYPFNFPSIKTVLGRGCINNVKGKTKGIIENLDPIHERNYGACMCASRKNLIAIGGADEHIDFLGHICGPYDMTFRLRNFGLYEIWHQTEFTYHTWHPGEGGANNYYGPHDGKHMSTTALEAVKTRRVLPLTQNLAIQALKRNFETPEEHLIDLIIKPEKYKNWNDTARIALVREEKIKSIVKIGPEISPNEIFLLGERNGYRLTLENNVFFARIIGNISTRGVEGPHRPEVLQSSSLHKLEEKVDQLIPAAIRAGTSQAIESSKKEFFISQFYLKVREGLGLIYRACRYRDFVTFKTLFFKLLNFPKFFAQRKKDAAQIVGEMHGTMSSVAAAIYFSCSNDDNGKKDITPPIVIVNTRYQNKYLLNLKKDPNFPPFSIIFIKNKTNLSSSLRTVKKENKIPKLVVWGTLYTQCYTDFLNANLTKNCIVV